MTFSKETRSMNIGRLANETFDLVIIGGGITGAGVALQAAASGFSTALIEMQDFAAGTSSRSTKMVHGGIRYLKTFDVGVVSDTVKERIKLQRIAPHIPKPTWMILPIYQENGATYDLFSVKIAMKLYDDLVGNKNDELTSRMLSKEEVLAKIPFLSEKNLLGGGSYLDYTNNDARLVIENIKKSADFGAVAASRVKAIGILHDTDGKISGIQAEDCLTHSQFSIRSKFVLNAAGPWVDKIDALDNQVPILPQLRPTKGIHLVVNWLKLPIKQPVYVDSLHHDDRMVFIIPRNGKTYFGTTDTDYHGDLTHPQITKQDLDYLLFTINQRFPKANITLNDIEASWAGIRPLIASNASSDYNGGGGGHITDQSIDSVISYVNSYRQGRASRSDIAEAILASEQTLSEKYLKPSQISRGSSLQVQADGLIVLSGGKITDYRRMAAGTINLLIKLMKTTYHQEFSAADSTKIPVSGGQLNPDNVESDLNNLTMQGVVLGLTEKESTQITRLFGSNAPQIFSRIKTTKAAPGLSLAETLVLHYSLEEEMVLTPTDYLLRRTNHILFNSEQLDKIVPAIIEEMAKWFNWSETYRIQLTEDVAKVISESNLAYLKAGQSYQSN